MGSSPRVRGTVNEYLYPHKRLRIIPACAGNRENWESMDVTIRDHPRVCGEQLTFAFIMQLRKGSSPRVRGTVFSALNFS